MDTFQLEYLTKRSGFQAILFRLIVVGIFFNCIYKTYQKKLPPKQQTTCNSRLLHQLKIALKKIDNSPW